MGDYQAETTYKYVGKGAGEFEMVTVPTNIKPGYFYCVVAFALVAVVIYLLNPMAPTTTTTPGPTTSLPYDCNAGYHGCYHCLIKQWSVSKLAWCCAHMGRGCPTAAPR